MSHTVVRTRAKAASTAVSPTLVGSGAVKAASNSSVSLVSTNMPPNTVTGDLIIAVVAWRRGTSAVISSSNAGATLLNSQVTGSSIRISVFWKLKAANETSWAFTVPAAATASVNIDVFGFRGFNAANPVSAPSIFNDTTSATTIPIPGMAVSPKAAVIAHALYVATASSRTATWGAPFTETSDLVTGTTGAYIGTSAATGFDDGTGVVPSAVATISTTQGNRVGLLIPVNPA